MSEDTLILSRKYWKIMTAERKFRAYTKKNLERVVDLIIRIIGFLSKEEDKRLTWSITDLPSCMYGYKGDVHTNAVCCFWGTGNVVFAHWYICLAQKRLHNMQNTVVWEFKSLLLFWVILIDYFFFFFLKSLKCMGNSKRCQDLQLESIIYGILILRGHHK